MPGEDLVEAVIIGDRCQRGSVGCERDRGVTRPVLLVAADDFSGDVLRVTGAAAIADDQNLVARARAMIAAAMARAAASIGASLLARSRAASDCSR